MKLVLKASATIGIVAKEMKCRCAELSYCRQNEACLQVFSSGTPATHLRRKTLYPPKTA